ncbi:MAG: 4-hydroxyphenylpyruvate dioxygenase [Microcoleaceae cyanobacterium]
MEFDHIHFYVQDAQASRDWFVQRLGFQAVFSFKAQQTHTEIVNQGQIWLLLSSPLGHGGPVDEYLRLHPPGVADVAFRVQNLENVLQRATTAGAKVQRPVQNQRITDDSLKWARIMGWGGIRHTLVERTKPIPENPEPLLFPQVPELVMPAACSGGIFAIDHVVLNVATGHLRPALEWYQSVFGFQPEQCFNIQTCRSGLQSQVLTHPQGSVQFPINQPDIGQACVQPLTRPRTPSQIQEFLDLNQGAGIQHIALQTTDIIKTVQQLRANHLPFLCVPTTYYQAHAAVANPYLQSDWPAIQAGKILVDWQPETPEAVLLQIFTQPIFDVPTFFFELIERRSSLRAGRWVQAQGFGERNFQALFEAIEQEQLSRNI